MIMNHWCVYYSYCLLQYEYVLNDICLFCIQMVLLKPWRQKVGKFYRRHMNIEAGLLISYIGELLPNKWMYFLQMSWTAKFMLSIR